MKKDKLTKRLLFFSPTVEAGWENQSHITDFRVEDRLGTGSFGTVYKAVNKKTGKIYAIKEIKKAALDSRKLLEHARTQVKIMYQLNHPNIIKLYNHFQDEVSIFLVLQYASKGQLYTLLKNTPSHQLPESTASPYITQITKGIAQIHRNNIMHRDLKLQNILVDGNNVIKIADFGWSHFVMDQEKRTTYCGTLDYLAPEMIDAGHKHDQRVDIWSIGVLTYQLCTGYSPFSCTLTGKDISIENVKKNIRELKYYLPKQLSEQCQDLIKNLLKKSPEDRLTIPQILSHPWILKYSSSGPVPGIDTGTGTDKKQLSLNQNWLQSLTKEMKEMFPEESVKGNNGNNGDGKYFTTEEIYKFSRPDSVINLKAKKRKDEVSPVLSKKIEQSTISLDSTTTTTSSPNPKTPTQIPSPFQYKKLSTLQLKITQLQHQHKSDLQQISRLKDQLQKNKQHTDCKTQIKQLMQQILKQNKIMQQLNNKLNQSQRKVMMLEKERRNC